MLFAFHAFVGETYFRTKEKICVWKCMVLHNLNPCKGHIITKRKDAIKYRVITYQYDYIFLYTFSFRYG